MNKMFAKRENKNPKHIGHICKECDFSQSKTERE